jgi:CHAD domain-containing protein
MVADVARQDLIQETLGVLQASLQHHLRALSRNVTTEGIHQARISIRRMRVALRAMEHQLLPSWRRRYLLALREFASDLEQAREADARVALVGELIAHNSLAHRRQASLLRNLLAAQRAEARQDLRGLLTTVRWKRRLARLRRDSRAPLIMAPSDVPLLPIRDILSRRQRRLRRALRHIGRKPRKLHHLRLRIKESRYLDEIFGSLLTASPDRELEGLRQLQNRLGEFHDNWRLKKWLPAQPNCHSIAAKLRVIVNTRQARLLKIIARLSHDMRKQFNC